MDCPPFTDAIQQRTEWDNAVEKQKPGPLVVGALVTCRKEGEGGKGSKGTWVGRGEIIQLDSPEGPGAVRLAIAKGNTRVEKFSSLADLKIKVVAPLYVGAHVTCQSGHGELIALESQRGPGIVRLDLGRGSSHEVPFQSTMHFNVRLVPPPFVRVHRKERKDALDPIIKKAVKDTYHMESATSPCKKDRVRKWLAPLVYIVTQKMFLMNTLQGVYATFKVNYPHYVPSVSFSAFKKMRGWYIRAMEGRT